MFWEHLNVVGWVLVLYTSIPDNYIRPRTVILTPLPVQVSRLESGL